MHWILGMILAVSTAAAVAQPFVEVDLVDAQGIDPLTNQGSFGDRVRLAGDGRTRLAEHRRALGDVAARNAELEFRLAALPQGHPLSDSQTKWPVDSETTAEVPGQ